MYLVYNRNIYSKYIVGQQVPLYYILYIIIIYILYLLTEKGQIKEKYFTIIADEYNVKIYPKSQ